MTTRKKGLSLTKYFPIILWIRSYTRKKFISDIIAGVTVGITMIPQSIAYSAFANLTPEYGLNSAFVGCFVYAIFGSIKEVFIGPTSLLALLAATYTHNLSPEFIVFLTFLCGCVEFFMGLLRLGFLVDLISAPVIGGFVSAVGVIIFISQLKDLMGIKLKSGNMIQNIISLITHINEIRYIDFILGITCIVALLGLRYVKDIKMKNNGKNYVQSILWVLSISRNAIVVFFCVCISALFQFYYNSVPFTLTASVHSGFPEFKLPPFSTQVGNVTYTFTEMVEVIGSGMFILPVVAILENIAIAKAFSKGKTVQATQEMFALSFSNILGSCFGAMPTCGALTRSAVGNASGVQSPIASFYSGAVVLVAVTFLSPYFNLIPRSTLAAVLICALLYLIKWEIVIPLWKTSKKDFFVMLVTFFISLIFGVEVGLLSGIAVSLLNLIYLWACPKITTNIYTVENGRRYILIKLDKGLYFPSMDRLRNSILLNLEDEEISVIVIDCSKFSGIDYTAIKDLSILINELNDQGYKFVLLNARSHFIELCHTIGHCKSVLSYKTKKEIEDCMCYEDKKKNPNEGNIKSKDYRVDNLERKPSKEILPLLANTSERSKEV